jgi:hypothetical protein
MTSVKLYCGYSASLRVDLGHQRHVLAFSATHYPKPCGGLDFLNPVFFWAVFDPK